MRFRLTVSFLSQLKNLIVKGFGIIEGAKSKLNLCISHNIQHAVTGVYPNILLNFNKIILTKGSLENVEANIGSSTAATVDFNWTNNSKIGLSASTDKAILVVYNPVKNRHVWMFTTIDRAAQGASLEVYPSFSGEEVHCWIAFVSEDGKEFSTSNYIGSVIVT